MIRKGWFSYLEILRNTPYWETCQHDTTIETETLNTEMPETSNQRQTLNDNNQDTSHPNTVEQSLTQEEKMNIDIMKIIMSEKKTELPSLKNQDWKIVKAQTEKNKRLINKYPNEQYHGIKQSNLCKSQTSLWKVGLPLKKKY